MQINKYKVKKKLGEGGFGEVYLAVHPTLKINVVIKRLTISKKRIIDMFRKEALTMVEFQNENVVNFYDHFEKGKDYYIVLEYVEGLNLADLIQNRPIPVAETLLIFREILKGVHYAHRKGVIHRDIKPGNILMSTDGKVKVADFGIAVQSSEAERKKSTFMGTPAYMPIELIEDTAKANEKTDIYALGVVLYMMLSGRRPFENDLSEENRRKIRKGKYKRIKGLPHWLNSMLKRMMHHKAVKRECSIEWVLNRIDNKLRVKDELARRNIIEAYVLKEKNCLQAEDPTVGDHTMMGSAMDDTTAIGDTNVSAGGSGSGKDGICYIDPLLVKVLSRQQKKYIAAAIGVMLLGLAIAIPFVERTFFFQKVFINPKNTFFGSPFNKDPEQYGLLHICVNGLNVIDTDKAASFFYFNNQITKRDILSIAAKRKDMGPIELYNRKMLTFFSSDGKNDFEKVKLPPYKELYYPLTKQLDKFLDMDYNIMFRKSLVVKAGWYTFHYKEDGYHYCVSTRVYPKKEKLYNAVYIRHDAKLKRKKGPVFKFYSLETGKPFRSDLIAKNFRIPGNIDKEYHLKYIKKLQDDKTYFLDFIHSDKKVYETVRMVPFRGNNTKKKSTFKIYFEKIRK